MLNRYAFFYFDFWRASASAASPEQQRDAAAFVTVLEAASAADAAYLMGRRATGKGYAITAAVMEMEATEVEPGEYQRRDYEAARQQIKPK